MGWLGVGSHRRQGRQFLSAVGTPPRYPQEKGEQISQTVCRLCKLHEQWAYYWQMMYWSTRHFLKTQDIRPQDRDRDMRVQDQDTKNAPRDRLETEACLETSHPCQYAAPEASRIHVSHPQLCIHPSVMLFLWYLRYVMTDVTELLSLVHLAH